MASNRQERYTLGYNQGVVASMSSRSASSEAGFLLPYLQPGMDVLDCGCGPGTITVGLAEFVSPGQVVGIDIEESQVERAQAHAAAQRMDNTRFQVGNIYQLGFPNNAFNAILVNAVFEHLGDPGQALQELYRVLKPGGVLGLRSPMSGDVVEPANPLADRTLQLLGDLRKHHGGDRTIGRRLRALLFNAGFVDVRASASFDFHGSSEETRFWGDRVARSMTEPPVPEQLIELGWATRTELDEIANFWTDWGGRPDALYARPWGEAVGWKAGD